MLTTSKLAPLGMFDPPSHPCAVEQAASLLFDRLGPLHGLGERDKELLCRSAVGVRFLRTMGDYSAIEHELFALALDELRPAEAFAIEAAACLATDHVALDPKRRWSMMRADDRIRVMWFAAILRLADALTFDAASAPDDVYAVWTEATLYIEVDGATAGGAELARTRAAAIEAITGRTLVVESSTRRRSSAGFSAA